MPQYKARGFAPNTVQGSNGFVSISPDYALTARGTPKGETCHVSVSFMMSANDARDLLAQLPAAIAEAEKIEDPAEEAKQS